MLRVLNLIQMHKSMRNDAFVLKTYQTVTDFSHNFYRKDVHFEWKEIEDLSLLNDTVQTAPVKFVNSDSICNFLLPILCLIFPNFFFSLLTFVQKSVERIENHSEASETLTSDANASITASESRKVSEKSAIKKKSSLTSDGTTSGQKKKVKKAKKSDSEKENISVVSKTYIAQQSRSFAFARTYLICPSTFSKLSVLHVWPVWPINTADFFRMLFCNSYKSYVYFYLCALCLKNERKKKQNKNHTKSATASDM